ncbi:uncharacterized protein LOC111355834 [Spodoptera litura]|uniref:Uncharacterized protein LOC111355834 n=1 Tax=Spodoptera litura TaxID=69820 RepID=A0A9J7IWC9_SPOLT|nr:uncharacterized protein LOC111355834 [Spodoptera litura]
MADSRHVIICALVVVGALCSRPSVPEGNDDDILYIDNDIVLGMGPPTCDYSKGIYNPNLIPDTEWPFYVRSNAVQTRYIVPVNMGLHRWPIHAAYVCVKMPKNSKSQVKFVKISVKNKVAVVTIRLKNATREDVPVSIQIFNKVSNSKHTSLDIDNLDDSDVKKNEIDSAIDFVVWE